MGIFSNFLPHNSSPPILLYHQIALTSPEEDPFRLGVPPEIFNAQMKYLKDNGYSTIKPQDYADNAEITQNKLDKMIVLTFDDGYLNHYTNAFPILQKYGFSAIIFIVTDSIGKSKTWDANGQVPLMEWSHLKEMSRYGISFESHTCTHPDLTKISDEAILQEFLCSKGKIEDLLGIPVRSLAYPYGKYNQRITQLAEQAGFQSAFTSGLSEGDRFAKERFQVTLKENKFLFALKASGWGSWIRKTYHGISGLLI
jgi:peptidoglycan/xylan/chitin deacetylase (PgdA/CDA1 family)